MRRALTRTNPLFESGKVQRLRKALHSRSTSEAVRRVIEERLAVETGLGALRTLRELDEDVFGRAQTKKFTTGRTVERRMWEKHLLSINVDYLGSYVQSRTHEPGLDQCTSHICSGISRWITPCFPSPTGHILRHRRS
jgi:hypothetical protein